MNIAWTNLTISNVTCSDVFNRLWWQLGVELTHLQRDRHQIVIQDEEGDEGPAEPNIGRALGRPGVQNIDNSAVWNKVQL